MTQIIGLHGPIGSGKDTLGLEIKKLYEGHREVVILKCADALYAMAAQVDPAFHPLMAHELKDGFVLNDPSLGTRRNFLEKLATEFARDMIHKDFWVMLLQANIRTALAKNPNALIVITDVRFRNEAKAIRFLSGTLVHLRPNWGSPHAATTKHSSTEQLTPWDDDLLLYSREGQAKDDATQLLKYLDGTWRDDLLYSIVQSVF